MGQEYDAPVGIRYPAIVLAIAVATLAGCNGAADSTITAAPGPAKSEDLTGAETSLLRTASRNVAAHCEPYLDPAYPDPGDNWLVVFENALAIANPAVVELVREKAAAPYDDQFGIGSVPLRTHVQNMANELQDCGKAGRDAAAALLAAAGR